MALQFLMHQLIYITCILFIHPYHTSYRFYGIFIYGIWCISSYATEILKHIVASGVERIPWRLGHNNSIWYFVVGCMNLLRDVGGATLDYKYYFRVRPFQTFTVSPGSVERVFINLSQMNFETSPCENLLHSSTYPLWKRIKHDLICGEGQPLTFSEDSIFVRMF